MSTHTTARLISAGRGILCTEDGLAVFTALGPDAAANEARLIAIWSAHDVVVAENVALREKLARKDDVLKTTVNAVLMPDPVREQNAYLLLALRAVADTAQSLMDMATRQKDHAKLMAHGDPVYADIFGKWQATIDAAKSASPTAANAGGLPAGVTLKAFQAHRDKQWCITVQHPFGTSWVRMGDVRDVRLAELIAAHSPTTNGAAGQEGGVTP